VYAGVGGFDLADRLERLDRVAAGLLLAGGDGEREAVHDDVADTEAPTGRQVVDEPRRDPYLPLCRPGLALFVDAERDHGGAVLSHQLHHLVVAGGGTVTVLEVHRVDHRAAWQVLKPCAQHRGFGRVEHDRKRHGRSEPRGECRHVRDAVASHVVDAEVEQVSALTRLSLGDVDALVPVLGEHRVTESPGAVGVRPLADGEVRGVLVELDLLVQTRDRGFVLERARRDGTRRDGLGEATDVLGGRSAATAHEREPVVGRVPVERLGEAVRRERVRAPSEVSSGRPALGITEMRQRACLER